MSLFGAVLRTAVNIVALPVRITEEVVCRAAGTTSEDFKRSMPLPSSAADKLTDVIDSVDED